MNADERAVAEWFKCDCGYDEASATCFDSGHDLGCKSRHSDVGTALAARIRADAERETAAALARAERAETLVREAGVMLKQREFDRGDGVTIWCGDCGTEARPHLSICPYAALLARIAELEKP